MDAPFESFDRQLRVANELNLANSEELKQCTLTGTPLIFEIDQTIKTYTRGGLGGLTCLLCRRTQLGSDLGRWLWGWLPLTRFLKFLKI